MKSFLTSEKLCFQEKIFEQFWQILKLKYRGQCSQAGCKKRKKFWNSNLVSVLFKFYSKDLILINSFDTKIFYFTLVVYSWDSVETRSYRKECTELHLMSASLGFENSWASPSKHIKHKYPFRSSSLRTNVCSIYTKFYSDSTLRVTITRWVIRRWRSFYLSIYLWQQDKVRQVKWRTC